MLDKVITSLTSPTFGFLLKLFAGLTTAAFGILGVGVTTRGEDGRLNRKGLAALIGILVGGVLAVGTSVYEFASGQEKDRADRQRNERLLLSVESGVYPMRQVKASFEIYLADKFDGAVAYRKSLRDLISKDPNCKTAKLPYECDAADIQGKYHEYRINRSSPLFPRTSSPVRDVLESLSIYVILFKQISKEEEKSGKPTKYLGSFAVDFRQGLPAYSWLSYDYDHDSLSFSAEHYSVKDESVIEAGVYSLVEFFPGVIAAGVNFNDFNLCNKLSQSACETKVDAVEKGLVLEEMTLAFPYPKNIRLTRGQATECIDGDRQNLLLHLPNGIEAIDGLGNIDNFKLDSSPQQSCYDLQKDSP